VARYRIDRFLLAAVSLRQTCIDERPGSVAERVQDILRSGNSDPRFGRHESTVCEQRLGGVYRAARGEPAKQAAMLELVARRLPADADPRERARHLLDASMIRSERLGDARGALTDAAEALRMGFVTRLHPPEALIEATRAYARDLAENVSPRSMKVIKRQLYDVPYQTLAEAILAANREMLDSTRSEDFKEGVAHFVEKRKARFSGR